MIAPVSLLLALAPPAPVVDAPISHVTVFSDRARVTRRAAVPVDGTARVSLPLLVDSVDAASIRVAATGAQLGRVEIAHVDEADVPPSEARALLERIEKVDDRIAEASAVRGVREAVMAVVRGVAPTAPPPEPGRPAPRLAAGGWRGVLAFVDAWLARLSARVRESDEALRVLREERAELSEKARILGGARRLSGHRVTVVLSGHGEARLAIDYMATGARWQPAYDLSLDTPTSRVQVRLSGLVSQSTGEDWDDAALTLSTAVPATATELPKIVTWKIGARDRFIPTPPKVVEPPWPAPRALPPPHPLATDDRAELQRELLALAAAPEGARAPRWQAERTRAAKRDIDESAPAGNAYELQADELAAGEAKSEASAADNVLPLAQAPPPAAMPMPMPMAPAAVSEVANEQVASRRPGAFAALRGPASASVPTTTLGLAPPPGYVPPYYGPDLPVTLAGGYDLAFDSARRESVPSGTAARRVALLSQSWPVTVERRVYPALSDETYVTAEIASPSARALPGGPANLFVGDDPAGQARIDLIAPGQTFVLPLGLDRSIKSVRNVSLVEAQKGIFSKDDVGEYTVTIELANPYPRPLPIRVFDQVPVTTDKNVEIKLGKAEPAPSEFDKVKGALEFRVTVPPSGKSVVRFVYSIRRPKGWRMHQ